MISLAYVVNFATNNKIKDPTKMLYVKLHLQEARFFEIYVLRIQLINTTTLAVFLFDL